MTFPLSIESHRSKFVPNVPPKLARITPPTCPASMHPLRTGFPLSAPHLRVGLLSNGEWPISAVPLSGLMAHKTPFIVAPGAGRTSRHVCPQDRGGAQRAQGSHPYGRGLACCDGGLNLKPKTSSSVLFFWKEGKMNTRVTTLAVLISSVLLSNVQEVDAQTNPPPATATRPAETPQGQTSAPNASPPATRTQTTGESNQSPTVKKMNEDEKKKVDTTGK